MEIITIPVSIPSDIVIALNETEQELKNQFLPQILLWIISPILFLYNNVLAILSRKIIWRGIEYKLESTSKTKIEKTYCIFSVRVIAI